MIFCQKYADSIFPACTGYIADISGIIRSDCTLDWLHLDLRHHWLDFMYLKYLNNIFKHSVICVYHAWCEIIVFYKDGLKFFILISDMAHLSIWNLNYVYIVMFLTLDG